MRGIPNLYGRYRFWIGFTVGFLAMTIIKLLVYGSLY